jgi:molecular chaperone GrpE (heat shock protein)
MTEQSENALSREGQSEVAQLRAELAELRAEVARLDADLDESRRLNLRAAELLDIVYETLGQTQGLSE